MRTSTQSYLQLRRTRNTLITRAATERLENQASPVVAATSAPGLLTSLLACIKPGWGKGNA